MIFIYIIILIFFSRTINPPEAKTKTNGKKAEKTLLSPSLKWIDMVLKTNIKERTINIFLTLNSLKNPIKKKI